MNAIVPRKMDFPFDKDIPRHWFRGSTVGTQIANSLNLLFPMGERFFVRSVRHYLERLADDPDLMARVEAFVQQEGHHSREHERFLEIMRAQGYEIDEFLALYRRIAWTFFEPKLSPALRLSITVALEHFTASLAADGLEQDIFKDAHPVMRELLMWHAAEEIEHKAVAFDVLKKVDPRYSTRVLGLLLATFGLLGFWIGGTRMLIRQDSISRLDAIRQLVAAGRRGDLPSGLISRAFVDYLRVDFHPNQLENAQLARDYLASIGRAAA